MGNSGAFSDAGCQKRGGKSNWKENRGRREGSIKCGLKYERCIFQVKVRQVNKSLHSTL